MNEAALLKKARAVREEEHRLKLSRRLSTLDEVVGFIHDRGLVSMLGGSELPGLISALLGKPWKPTGKGFSSWLDWWNMRISGTDAGHLLMELPRREDIIGTRIFRNSKTFVSSRLWPVLDPIMRRYMALAKSRKILAQLELKILGALERKGPTRTDRLRIFLNMVGKTHTTKFHRALARLENHGLIVGFEDPKPETHLHAAIWHTWGQRPGPMIRTADSSYEDALARLLEQTIDACVIVPEKEVGNWYVWKEKFGDARQKLLAGRRITRARSFLVSARVAETAS